MIRDNVHRILKDIAEVCQKSGRAAQEVTLVGVTKFASLEAIQEAIDAGLRHIAENRVQEAEKKFPLLLEKNPQVLAHIIGHVQTNKAKDAVKICSLIQSVDSLKLAQEIDKQAAKMGKTVDVLVQFNTAREEQKFGAAPEEAEIIIGAMVQLPHLRIRGLMAMAPWTGDQDVVRKTFMDLRSLRENMQNIFGDKVDMGILSMGMSGDYKIAIEQGSTMVRIGSAIFKEAIQNV